MNLVKQRAQTINSFLCSRKSSKESHSFEYGQMKFSLEFIFVEINSPPTKSAETSLPPPEISRCRNGRETEKLPVYYDLNPAMTVMVR